NIRVAPPKRGGYGGYGAQTKISMPGSRGGGDAWIGPICRQAATFIVPAARKRLAMAGDRPGGPSSSPSPADRLRPEHAGSAIVSAIPENFANGVNGRGRDAAGCGQFPSWHRSCDSEASD